MLWFRLKKRASRDPLNLIQSLHNYIYLKNLNFFRSLVAQTQILHDQQHVQAFSIR